MLWNSHASYMYKRLNKGKQKETRHVTEETWVPKNNHFHLLPANLHLWASNKIIT
jgi:hypothetical protein